MGMQLGHVPDPDPEDSLLLGLPDPDPLLFIWSNKLRRNFMCFSAFNGWIFSLELGSPSLRSRLVFNYSIVLVNHFKVVESIALSKYVCLYCLVLRSWASPLGTEH